jgi:hypothetical protein
MGLPETIQIAITMLSLFPAGLREADTYVPFSQGCGKGDARHAYQQGREECAECRIYRDSVTGVACVAGVSAAINIFAHQNDQATLKLE